VGRGPGCVSVWGVFAPRILLALPGVMLVFGFPGGRVSRADGGGARRGGRGGMIGALRRLRRETEPQPLPEQMRAFGIPSPPAVMRLFMSHPPLEERIAALQSG